MKKLTKLFILTSVSVAFVLGCSSGDEKNDVKTSIVKKEDTNNSDNSNTNGKKEPSQTADSNKEKSNSEKSSDTTNVGKKDETSQKDDVNEGKTDSENTKNSEENLSNDTNQEENISDDKENLEENRVLKLYASSIKSTVFNMIGSNTYTLELFGEWSSNDMAILASKIREVPAECNIILDYTGAAISSGMEFLYSFTNLAVKIGKNSIWNFNFAFNLSSIQFRKIIIKDDVTDLPNYTFYVESFKTPYLESITIPASVKKIGYQAFFGCTKIKEVIIEDGDETLELDYNKDGGPALFGEGLFYDCPLEKVYIGRNLVYKKDARYGFSPFEPRRVSSNMKKTIGNNVTSY